MSEEFGVRLRVLRKERGLSQKRLALDLGFKTHAGVCKIETGRQLPSFEQLAKLSKALNVSVDFLVHGREQRKAS